MIKTRIQEVARSNGINNAYQLQKLTSLSPSMASRLFNDEVELIAMKTIEVLCNALNCNPGDLFSYKENSVIA